MMTKFLVWFTAVSVNLSALVCGLCFGWSSPVFPKLKDEHGDFRINLAEESQIILALPVGGITGCVLSVFLTNKIGRKYTMVVMVIPFVVNWLLIYAATTSRYLIFGRFFAGMAISMCYVAIPMYLGEISPANIRGIILTGMQVAEKCGVLLTYSYGPYVSVHVGALIAAVFPLLFGSILVWLPESPVYLIYQNCPEEAEKSLEKFYGKKNVTQEREIIEKSIDKTNSQKMGFREIIFVKGNRKALSIAMMLIIIQQFTGTAAVMSYAHEIFSASKTEIDAKFLAIVLASVVLVCTIICASLVDRKGRRPLLIISTIGCCFSMTILALYFHAKHHNYEMSGGLNWTPAFGILLFAIFHAVGLSPLPMVAAGELFSPNVKALSCSISIITINLACGFVVLLYPIISKICGVHIVFWFYALSAFFGGFYIYFFVPETRGKTLQEIQNNIHTVKTQH